MIWFGNLEKLFIGRVPEGLPGAAEDRRMQFALERVAEAAPWLSGGHLIDALEATGWVDRNTAQRLLPAFRHFDPDQHFADYLRKLSFRGRTFEEEFRLGIRASLQEILGDAGLTALGEEDVVIFEQGDFQGMVLTRPEVGLTVSGRTKDAVLAAVEQMPDTLMVVARSFDKAADDQLRGLLYGTGIRGTLMTVNMLLGLRAMTLRHQPPTDKLLDLIGRGGAIRSTDIARLGDELIDQRFHIPGWKSSSTV